MRGDLFMQIVTDKMIDFGTGSFLHDLMVPEVEHTGISCGTPYNEYPDKWEVTTNAVLKNIYVLSGHKWGSRSHGVGSAYIENCHMANIEVEHGWYWNLADSALQNELVLFKDCTVQNVGGQAWQFTARETETHPDNWGRMPMTYLYKCAARNTALRPDHRGAYAYSFHQPNGEKQPNGQFGPSENFWGEAVLHECILDNTMQERSRGMLLMKGRYFVQIIKSWFASRTFEKSGIYGGQTAVQIIGPNKTDKKRALLIDGSYFNEIEQSNYGKIIIDQFDDITIKNCFGNLPVFLEDQELGPIEGINAHWTRNENGILVKEEL